jgi:hypothetical protein
MTYILIYILGTLFSNQIYINEVVSDNDNVILDFEGDSPDWVELYNPNDFEVDLYDYSLSDKATDPVKWTFPKVVMAPKSFLIIFCSGKNIKTENELHTNFRLSSSGETLYLYDNNPIIMQRKRLDVVDIPPLRENKAYGKLPDGDGKLSYLSKNSPGKTNHFSDEIICSVESGFYEIDSIEVELKSTMGFKVHYTLDGSDPDENSPIYRKPIKLTNSNEKENKYSLIETTPPKHHIADNFYSIPPNNNLDKLHILKYASFINEKKASAIYNNDYFIGKSNNYQNIPIVSLNVDSLDLFGFNEGIYVPGVHYDSSNQYWSGNYYSISTIEEKKAYLTYFDENHRFQYSQYVTIQIAGGGSRRLPQKSIKINGRNLNGPDEFYFNLHNSNISEFKKIRLKSVYGVWSLTNILQNELGNEIAQSLNFEKLNYRPAIVFLNGEYWGIHTLTEHKNKHYLEQFHKEHRDSVEIVMHHYLDYKYHNGYGYPELIEFMENNSLEIDMNYNIVENQFDIDSYIDYFIFQIVIRNYDWPFGNILCWRTSNPSSKWRWILYDLDAGFVEGEIDYNMFVHLLQDEHNDWPNSKNSTLTFRNLIKNSKFKEKLVDRCREIIRNEFNFNKTSELYYKVRDYYTPYMQNHYLRWGYPFNYDDIWQTYSDNYLLSFLEKRPPKVLEHLQDFINISSYNLDECPGNQCDENGITFYPNPSNGVFNAKVSSKYNTSNLTLYNSVGKVLDNKYNIHLSNYTFDYPHLPNGFYFIKFENKYGQYTFEKFIINK